MSAHRIFLPFLIVTGACQPALDLDEYAVDRALREQGSLD